jgi:putative spermidine/putrescine transport system ATP-binding protein
MADGDRVAIALMGVSKRFDRGAAAVDDVTLEIRDGEFFSLLGPSGCGKTTSLRMIAGFATPDSGRVLLQGVDVTGVPANRRHVNMVFQHYALFPHLTVEENVGFALRVEGQPRSVIRQRVTEMLDLVQLPGVASRRPGELSGGQQQRVALARALAFSPRILLMDEPLGALDLKLREQMQLELKRIQRDVGITTIHVTHDQEEALSLSDRVVVMAPGRIAQVDSPERLYDAPRTRYVADFVGKVNFMRAEVVDAPGGGLACRLVDVPSRPIVRCPASPGCAAGEAVTLGIRPEYLRARSDGDAASLHGEIEKVRFAGNLQFLFVRIAPSLILMVADPQRVGLPGKACAIDLDESRILIFTESGEKE